MEIALALFQTDFYADNLLRLITALSDYIVSYCYIIGVSNWLYVLQKSKLQMTQNSSNNSRETIFYILS